MLAFSKGELENKAIMIIGIGTDLIDIARIHQAYCRFGDRFLTRIFTPNEQQYCNQKPALRFARYAKRFAAKEACLKALGTGRSQGIRWIDLEITNTPLGQPTLALSGRCQKVAQERHGTFHIHLSLTDTATTAQAFVILEGIS